MCLLLQAYSDRNAVYNSNQDNVEFDNPVYAEGNTNNGIDLQDLAKDRLGKEELVNHNLDRSSIEKRNDIRVRSCNRVMKDTLDNLDS